MSQQPAYRAYTVVKRDGQKDFWLPIGAAFQHGSGDGMTVMLEALPMDGRIVLRKPKSEDERNQRREERRDTSQRDDRGDDGRMSDQGFGRASGQQRRPGNRR